MSETLDIHQILSTLDSCLLIREEKYRFRLPSQDSWIHNIKDFSNSHNLILNVAEDFGFLSTFLESAEDFWKEKSNGTLDSGFWGTSTNSGEEVILEIIAIKGEHPDCLLIKKLHTKNAKEHFQEAREILLKREILEGNIQLAESELTELNHLIDSFPDTMLRCSMNGSINKISSKHYTLREARNIKELFPQSIAKRIAPLISLCLENQKLSSLEYSQDNQCFEVRLKALSEDEVLLVIRDISQQKRLEIKLREARIVAEKATKAKSSFLANMSHEIRTPMNGVMGMLQLLMSSDVNEQQQEHLKLMQRSADSLLNLINDILDLSKVEAGKLEISKANFRLEDEINDVINLLDVKAKEKGIELKTRLSKNIPDIIFSDRNRLRQVLINLIGNAIKFTDTGLVTLDLDFQNDELDISVKDTGPGISLKEQEKLFKAFEQTSSAQNKGGTGLGLVISQKIIELLGGQIFIKSALNKGTTVSFSLKEVSENKLGTNAEKEKKELACEAKSLNRFKILLVEDNLVNQKVVEGMLKQTKVNIEIAKTGPEALKMFDEKEYDAILMDCNLPEKDGYEVTREIRKNESVKNSIPIIGVTASAMLEDKNKCFDAGMSDYLTKPVNSSLLISTLSKWLNP